MSGMDYYITHGTQSESEGPLGSYQSPDTKQEATQGGQTETSGGGMDMISGIIASGVDTGAIISEYLFAKYETERLERWREEDLQREAERYEDILKQQAWQNQMQRRGAELAEDQFDFGRMKWKNEFNFTKDQAKQADEWRKKEWKQMGLDKVALQLQNTINNDANLKNAVLQRAGF